ncbi:MAG: hypothetical protein M0030_26715 [Actinomycetota bacterium]|nr:hypothetical protein [Actinomycetota bacterium]
MTTSAASTAAADRRGLAAVITDAAGWLSTRIHAAGDARARAAGWEITRTPGRAGLTGRTYHDPRFATRRAPEGRTVTTQERRAA